MDISNNGMVTLAHVRVEGAQFNIHISVCVETKNIHIFKYNQQQCDYGVFDSQDSACDYINAGMPRGRWGFSED